MKKVIAGLIFMLFISACAGPQTVWVVDQTGRVVPSPSYTMYTTNNPKIQATYYWYGIQNQYDVDGHIIYNPTYLDCYSQPVISNNTYNGMFLTLEILNTVGNVYRVWESSTIHYKNGKSMMNQKPIGTSNRIQRSYNIPLPYDNKIDYVDYGVYITDKKDKIRMNLGTVKYKVK